VELRTMSSIVHRRLPRLLRWLAAFLLLAAALAAAIALGFWL
jgi:hypothetical protein